MYLKIEDKLIKEHLLISMKLDDTTNTPFYLFLLH